MHEKYRALRVFFRSRPEKSRHRGLIFRPTRDLQAASHEISAAFRL
jgi:hypothetical protein